ncbi:hypothetical protein [Pelotalea chapellei]|uniref:Uncharacterized protein n=1 Tax=Pelotalea chapellei TaxID=44671 RepID=A0ABS5U5Q1_9BACT|nr:hypothetical protein [Pelotalea chapellei]MBT1070995.1 hypothetical protein [Pelotalea chapellei]
MKKPLPHFACYPGDFFADPRFNRLPGEVRGTWCQLVFLMWHQGHETQLADDDEEICLYLNLDMEVWLEHRNELERVKLLRVDTQMRRLYNNRLEREYRIADSKCQTQRSKAIKRWHPDGENAESMLDSGG